MPCSVLCGPLPTWVGNLSYFRDEVNQIRVALGSVDLVNEWSQFGHAVGAQRGSVADRAGFNEIAVATMKPGGTQGATQFVMTAVAGRGRHDVAGGGRLPSRRHEFINDIQRLGDCHARHQQEQSVGPRGVVLRNRFVLKT